MELEEVNFNTLQLAEILGMVVGKKYFGAEFCCNF